MLDGFQCNICGTYNTGTLNPEDREVPGCRSCGSTIRTRAVMQVLAQELFGTTMPVRDFPRLKGLRGAGTSDSHDYASLLEEKFDYRNTFYHREPKLDITDIAESEAGQYDFFITSEVLEHVAPPVERALSNLCRLLKPHGVLILTVPYLETKDTAEHFPNLHDYTVAALRDRFVLVNRTRDGEYEVHEDLIFHGGPGSTLEMRLLGGQHLRRMLNDAGFRELEIYPGPSARWGIAHPGDWSLPIAARKEPFVLSRTCSNEWAEQWREHKSLIEKQWSELAVTRSFGMEPEQVKQELQARTDWIAKLDADLAEAANQIRELQAEVKIRSEWAMDMDRQRLEKAEWAARMQRELEEYTETARNFKDHADDLRAQLDAARAELEELRNSRGVRVARKLGLG